jgi:hypothetical protein
MVGSWYLYAGVVALSLAACSSSSGSSAPPPCGRGTVSGDGSLKDFTVVASTAAADGNGGFDVCNYTSLQPGCGGAGGAPVGARKICVVLSNPGGTIGPGTYTIGGAPDMLVSAFVQQCTSGGTWSQVDSTQLSPTDTTGTGSATITSDPANSVFSGNAKVTFASAATLTETFDATILDRSTPTSCPAL